MSQENVEIVRGIYADPHGLTSGASGKVAADAEFDFTAVYLDRPILRGVEESAAFVIAGLGAVPRSISSQSVSSTWTTSVFSCSYECWPPGAGAVRQSRSERRMKSRSATSLWCASRRTGIAIRRSKPSGCGSRARRTTPRALGPGARDGAYNCAPVARTGGQEENPGAEIVRHAPRSKLFPIGDRDRIGSITPASGRSVAPRGLGRRLSEPQWTPNRGLRGPFATPSRYSVATVSAIWRKVERGENDPYAGNNLGAPDRIRTCDLRFRRPTRFGRKWLYQAEYGGTGAPEMRQKIQKRRARGRCPRCYAQPVAVKKRARRRNRGAVSSISSR